MSDWKFVVHEDEKVAKQLQHDALIMGVNHLVNSLLLTHVDLVGKEADKEDTRVKDYTRVVGVVYDLWINAGNQRAHEVLQCLIKKIGTNELSKAASKLAMSNEIESNLTFDFIKFLNNHGLQVSDMMEGVPTS